MPTSSIWVSAFLCCLADTPWLFGLGKTDFVPSQAAGSSGKSPSHKLRSNTDGPAQQDGGTQLNVTPDFSGTGFAFKLSCGSKRKRLSGISALFLPLKRNTTPKAVPH